MSLIKCPECGKEISDKASACPNCGCPSIEWKNKNLKSDAQIECEGVGEIIFDIIQKHSPNDKVGMITELSNRAGCELKEASIIIDKYMKHSKDQSEISICPFCNNEIIIDDGYCPICNMRIEPFEVKHSINDISQSCEKKEFHGIYRYGIFGGKAEIYCPRCHSENCSYFQEQNVVPGKTKTRYTANLNPLKPFTLVNKKEKIVKRDKIVTESKIICNDCGWVFK